MQQLTMDTVERMDIRRNNKLVIEFLRQAVLSDFLHEDNITKITALVPLFGAEFGVIRDYLWLQRYLHERSKANNVVPLPLVARQFGFDRSAQEFARFQRYVDNWKSPLGPVVIGDILPNFMADIEADQTAAAEHGMTVEEWLRHLEDLQDDATATGE